MPKRKSIKSPNSKQLNLQLYVYRKIKIASTNCQTVELEKVENFVAMAQFIFSVGIHVVYSICIEAMSIHLFSYAHKSYGL